MECPFGFSSNRKNPNRCHQMQSHQSFCRDIVLSYLLHIPETLCLSDRISSNTWHCYRILHQFCLILMSDHSILRPSLKGENRKCCLIYTLEFYSSIITITNVHDIFTWACQWNEKQRKIDAFHLGFSIDWRILK